MCGFKIGPGHSTFLDSLNLAFEHQGHPLSWQLRLNYADVKDAGLAALDMQSLDSHRATALAEFEGMKDPVSTTICHVHITGVKLCWAGGVGLTSGSAPCAEMSSAHHKRRQDVCAHNNTTRRQTHSVCVNREAGFWRPSGVTEL